MKHLLVYVTATSEREAFKIAEDVLVAKLAACANIGKDIHSIYWWNGVVEQTDETPILFKTTEDKFSQLEKLIKKLHSYENPCIVATEIDKAPPQFLQWISDSVK